MPPVRRERHLLLLEAACMVRISRSQRLENAVFRRRSAVTDVGLQELIRTSRRILRNLLSSESWSALSRAAIGGQSQASATVPSSTLTPTLATPCTAPQPRLPAVPHPAPPAPCHHGPAGTPAGASMAAPGAVRSQGVGGAMGARDALNQALPVSAGAQARGRLRRGAGEALACHKAVAVAVGQDLAVDGREHAGAARQ